MGHATLALGSAAGEGSVPNVAQATPWLRSHGPSFFHGIPEPPRLRKRYVRHQPENSVLVQVMQAWLETLLAMVSEA